MADTRAAGRYQDDFLYDWWSGRQIDSAEP